MAFQRGVRPLNFGEFVYISEKEYFDTELTIKDEDGLDNYLTVLFKHAQDLLDNRTKNLLINLPPRTGKSRYMGIYLIAYAFGINARCKFLYLHQNDELAKNQVRLMHQVMTTDFYRKIFTTRITDKSWKQCSTQEGGSLITASIGSGITGFSAGTFKGDHIGFNGAIIFDEPHLAEHLYRPQEMHSVIEKFNISVVSRVNNDKTPFLVIGHRVANNDIFDNLVKNNKFNWTHVIIPARNPETGKTINQHTLSDKILERMEEASEKAFAAQYMQCPVRYAETIFNGDYISIQTPEVEKDKIKIYGGKDVIISIDPNGHSTSSPDETSIMVASAFFLDSNRSNKLPCILIEEIYAKKEPNFKFICNSLAFYINKYSTRIKAVLIESHTHGTALHEAMCEMATNGLLTIQKSSLKRVYRKINKRIFMQRASNHVFKRVYIRDDKPHYEKFFKELSEITMHNENTKDDITDSFSEILTYIFEDRNVNFIREDCEESETPHRRYSML